MKELMFLNKKQLKNHIFIWIFIIIYLRLIGSFYGNWIADVAGRALTDLNFIFVFYSISLLIFPILWNKNLPLLVLCILICLLLFWFNYHYVIYKIIPSLGGVNKFQKGTLFHFLERTFFFFIVIASAAIASFFNRYGLYKIKLQVEKEKSLLIKELSFLKNQFNSHITFNFLNYCYSKLHKNLPQVADSIEVFSEILRYNLKTKPEENVLLSEEVAYIDNIIHLQKILNESFFINFNYNIESNDITILSHVLAAFVEEAINNGVINNKKCPVLINLNSDNDNLSFSISYQEKISGNSINNIKDVEQILNIFYKNLYKLKYSSEKSIYYMELTIELNEIVIS